VFGNSFGSALQYHEWTSFISDTEFCFRACVRIAFHPAATQNLTAESTGRPERCEELPTHRKSLSGSLCKHTHSDCSTMSWVASGLVFSHFDRLEFDF
jgi:hypothetical protein